MTDSQMRSVQITINNPAEQGFERDKIIFILNMMNLSYYCLVDEIGESGTYHTHIYMKLVNAIRFSRLKKLFPTAHIEKAMGTSRQNREYLLKEGKWADTDKSETTVEGSFMEWGELPDERSETMTVMQQVQEELKDGASIADIIAKHPGLSLKTNQLEATRQVILAERYSVEMRELTVTYIFGDTGTGKTRGIFEAHDAADICRITEYGYHRALFDNYASQSVLVFEEFRGDIPLGELLVYLDRYPCSLPARYTNRWACYTTVYFTSNVPLSDLYRYEQANEPASWNALLRRIDTVREYTGVGEYTDRPCTHNEEEGFVPVTQQMAESGEIPPEWVQGDLFDGTTD